MLCGILEPTEGTAEVLGLDVRHHPESVKEPVVYISQRLSLWGDLMVLLNLEFYAGV
jgi:ABC-2 type transport system ATP-binding protein